MIKVSVIIPVYNVEQYLEKCLDSVCGQTLKDIEIICVNDCSADNSLAVLKDYAKNDNRVKLIDFKENKGVSAARNEGIKNAQGEYIGFVDSDDWIDLNFYEKLYNKAIKTDADIVKGNLITYYEDKPCMISALNKLIGKDNNKLYFYCNFYSAIYKKELFVKNKIEFDSTLIYGEDTLFLNKIILAAQKPLQLIDDVFYYYNKRENSADTRFLTFEKIDSGITVYEQIIHNFLQSEYKNCVADSFNFIITYHFLSIIQLCYRCQTQQMLDYCIDKIMMIYPLISKYIQKDTQGLSEEYLTALNNNDKKLFRQLCAKYNSQAKMICANLRKLRANKK